MEELLTSLNRRGKLFTSLEIVTYFVLALFIPLSMHGSLFTLYVTYSSVQT
jgi:hypothetical protein